MKGLAFSAAMVPLVMSGAKTVTRRVSAVQWKRILDRLADGSVLTERLFHRADQWVHPRYQPGEVVYVKEALENHNGAALYRSDGVAVVVGEGHECLWAWKRNVLPSRFMPQYAARTFLEIVSVRPEPLQEISRYNGGTAQDFLDEGVTLAGEVFPTVNAVDKLQARFVRLWDSLHKKKNRWADNDWVWRYEFKQKDGE